ncbi:MAG: Rpn family recombination-promoting nuclease/putative transposase, partial [Gracilibacteraceae bacterium]|nr:Rpn family recombination-promoting nuclease/putative transposase [Gracilibacteraceae bacterium]
MDTIHDARDNFMKIVMRNNNYYAQFIRDFSMNQLLKNVQPEDIEDISERFIPLVTDGQDADTVKQIRLSGTEEPVFIISLTEHQSSVRFDIAIKLLQYMVYIWIDYCRRNDEKCDENKKNGIEDPRLVRSSAKGFKLPPILPIVYYDGEHTWTADRNFAERVFPRAGFEEYIPQFSYVLVDLNQYSREELQSNQNLMSLVMILDKIKTPEDALGIKQYAEPCLEAAEQSSLDILRQVTVLIMNKAGVDQSVIKKTVELYEGRPTQMFEVL